MNQRHDLVARIDLLRVRTGEFLPSEPVAHASGLSYVASRSQAFDLRLGAHFERANAKRVKLRSLSAMHESPDPHRLRSVQMEWSAQGSYAALRHWQIDLQQGDPFIAMLNLQLRSQTRDGAGEAVEARMSWVMYETP